MDSIYQVNRDALGLWQREFSSASKLVHWPMIYPEPQQHCLAVVGCNPALPTRNHHSVPIFDDREVADFEIKSLAELEIKARLKYPYFTQFRRLADSLALPFEHFDLFFYRETSQNDFKQKVRTTDGSLNLFGRRQFDLTKRLLELSKPRIILVANAFAADLFKKEFNLDSLDNDGLHRIRIADQNVPVFLSGMLTGQRALDVHSRERLFWHMHQARNSISGRSTLSL